MAHMQHSGTEAILGRTSPRRRLRPLLLVAVAALLLALVASRPAAAASSPTQAMAQARALAADWGRCPTARPANSLLRRAERTRAQKERARLARRAVGAYEKVADECILPVDEPRVTVPSPEGPVAPPPGG
jgi:hypothetical protein